MESTPNQYGNQHPTCTSCSFVQLSTASPLPRFRGPEGRSRGGLPGWGARSCSPSSHGQRSRWGLCLPCQRAAGAAAAAAAAAAAKERDSSVQKGFTQILRRIHISSLRMQLSLEYTSPSCGCMGRCLHCPCGTLSGRPEFVNIDLRGRWVRCLR